MATTFKNPANGHTEEVGGGASIAVLFFGALYLAYKGLWGHFAIWILVVGGFTLMTGGPGLLIALPLASIGYAIAIRGILEKSYMAKGWISGSKPSPQDDTRACPFCAESIKKAAVKCKHCGADIEAEAAPVLVSGWTATAWCRDESERELAIASIEAEGFPVVPMNDMNVAAGLFHTKDEAKRARVVLRDQQHLFTAVEYKDSAGAAS